MKELVKRKDLINHLRHFGKNDPNLLIYESYLKNGELKKAEKFFTYRQKWESAIRENKPAKTPLFVTFSLNDSCNLSCSHCYRNYNRHRTKKHFLKLNEVYRLISECEESGVPSIGIGTESEALLYKHIRKVIKFISKKQFVDFWVFTNGTLLNDSIIDLILDNNVTRLSVSIDAATNETYKKARGEGFYRVMSNIFNFLQKREKDKAGLPVLRVTFVKYNLTEHETGEFINFWSKIAEVVDIQPLMDIKNIDTLEYDSVSGAKCGYPNNMLYINWNGDYKPCCSEFSKHLTIGNIRDIGLKEAWNSGFLLDMRKQLKGQRQLNKACINCLRSLHSKEPYSPLKG